MRSIQPRRDRHERRMVHTPPALNTWSVTGFSQSYREQRRLARYRPRTSVRLRAQQIEHHIGQIDDRVRLTAFSGVSLLRPSGLGQRGRPSSRGCPQPPQPPGLSLCQLLFHWVQLPAAQFHLSMRSWMKACSVNDPGQQAPAPGRSRFLLPACPAIGEIVNSCVRHDSRSRPSRQTRQC